MTSHSTHPRKFIGLLVATIFLFVSFAVQANLADGSLIVRQLTAADGAAYTGKNFAQGVNPEQLRKLLGLK